MAFAVTVLALRRLTCFRDLRTFFELDFDTAWDDKKIREHAKERKERADEEEKELIDRTSSARMDLLTTQFFVDSRLRATMKKWRASIRTTVRGKGRGHQRSASAHEEGHGGGVELDEVGGGSTHDGNTLGIGKGAEIFV